MRFFRHQPIEDVHNPFALVHLWAFLKRHGWWMVPGVVAIYGFIYVQDLQESEELQARLAEGAAMFYSPERLLEFRIVGEPHPALDAAERYWYLRTKVSRDDLKEGADGGEVLAQYSRMLDPDWEVDNGLIVLGEDDRPVILLTHTAHSFFEPVYSEARDRFVFMVPHPVRDSLLQRFKLLAFDQDSVHTLAYLVDPVTGKPDRMFILPGSLRPIDVSPDGKWLATVRKEELSQERFFMDNELIRGTQTTLVLVNMDTGSLHDLPYRAAAGAFESTGDLLLVQSKAVLRLKKPEWEVESVLFMPEADSHYLGEQSWITPWGGGRLHFFLAKGRSNDVHFIEHAELLSLSLDGGASLFDAGAFIPLGSQDQLWIEPNVRGIANGEGCYVAMGDPAPIIQHSPEGSPVYTYRRLNLDADHTSWNIMKEGETLASSSTDRYVPPYFINSSELLLPSPTDGRTMLDLEVTRRHSHDVDIPITEMNWNQVRLDSVSEKAIR